MNRITAFVTSALVLGCAETPTPPVQADAATRSAMAVITDGAELAELRQATARFHLAERAAAAGWNVLVRHPVTQAACLSDAREGGMGRHMLNPALIDDAVIIDEPEVLIYEPQKNGRLRLVGVEYVIPYQIRPRDAAPPVLFGREFLHNDTFGLWMLHVYAWKNNPAGTFATWNPSITCSHDRAVH